MKDAVTAKEPTYDKWQAESDLRTLTEATAIKKDGKRMAAVKRAATEKLAEMAQLKQLAGKA
jgi:hypothetical protein